MAKVAKKPLEPRDKDTTSTAEVKLRKKRKASCQPKSSSPKKIRCHSRRRQRHGKIIRQGKRSLPKTATRKVSKNIKLNITKETSETALAMLIHEGMGGDVRMNAPEQSQLGLESSQIGAEDLNSSSTQSMANDQRNINV